MARARAVSSAARASRLSVISVGSSWLARPVCRRSSSETSFTSSAWPTRCQPPAARSSGSAGRRPARTRSSLPPGSRYTGRAPAPGSGRATSRSRQFSSGTAAQASARSAMPPGEAASRAAPVGRGRRSTRSTRSLRSVHGGEDGDDQYVCRRQVRDRPSACRRTRTRGARPCTVPAAQRPRSPTSWRPSAPLWPTGSPPSGRVPARPCCPGCGVRSPTSRCPGSRAGSPPATDWCCASGTADGWPVRRPTRIARTRTPRWSTSTRSRTTIRSG